VRIVQITDLHLDSDEPLPNGVDLRDHAEWALDEARRQEPDLVVLTGDLAFWMGTADTYREVARLLQGLAADSLVMPGNHDDRTLFAAAFGRRYRTTADYPWLDRQVNVAGTPMILLDSGDGVIDDRQLAWLEVVLGEYALAARRGEATRRLLLWTHHPVLTGFHRYMDANYPLRNAREVRDAMTAAIGTDGLEVSVFCGHYHVEDVRREGAIHQYCTPATYLQIDPETTEFRIDHRTPAVRLIDLDPNGEMTTSVIYRPGGERR
jgi:3',5'-cyclic-AMP phosphodiesterase